MTSAGETAEARIVSAAIPRIRLLCQRRWLNLEYEDRVCEALLLFVEDLRSKPLTSGHFFKDYLVHLHERMNDLNRKTPSLRFGRFSLETLTAGTAEGNVSGYGVLRSRLSDFSGPEVVEFMSSLTDNERQIIHLRMSGYGKRETSKALNMSVYQLEKSLGHIQRHYMDWSSGE